MSKELQFYEQNIDFDDDLNNEDALDEIFKDEFLPNGPFILKLKPCYNFQSIEFEIVIDDMSEAEIKKLKNTYKKVLGALKEATDEIIPVTSNPNNPDPPTEAQIKLLNKFGCKWTKSTTKAQARELINAAIERADAKKKKND